jgi:hypothetical protein
VLDRQGDSRPFACVNILYLPPFASIRIHSPPFASIRLQLRSSVALLGRRIEGYMSIYGNSVSSFGAVSPYLGVHRHALRRLQEAGPGRYSGAAVLPASITIYGQITLDSTPYRCRRTTSGPTRGSAGRARGSTTGGCGTTPIRWAICSPPTAWFTSRQVSSSPTNSLERCFHAVSTLFARCFSAVCTLFQRCLHAV